MILIHWLTDLGVTGLSRQVLILGLSWGGWSIWESRPIHTAAWGSSISTHQGVETHTWPSSSLCPPEAPRPTVQRQTGTICIAVPNAPPKSAGVTLPNSIHEKCQPKVKGMEMRTPLSGKNLSPRASSLPGGATVSFGGQRVNKKAGVEHPGQGSTCQPCSRKRCGGRTGGAQDGGVKGQEVGDLGVCA